MVGSIEKAIVNKANELLGEESEVVRVDPEGKNFTLSSQEYANSVVTHLRGAELLMSQYMFRYFGNITDSRQDLYAFYPDHTDHIIRYSTTQRDNHGFIWFLSSLEPEITKPANSQELTNLLEKITK